MTIRHWLAFDLGTTGVKAALVDRGGRILCSAIVDIPTHAAEGGVMEQKASDWWRSLGAACREIAPFHEAEAIALTGQMQDCLLLDADSLPIRPVILYSDTRARAEAETVLARLGLDRLRALTGNDQDAGSLLAKLLWLARHEPDSLSRCRSVLLGAADYAALRMTGRAVTDTTTASTTGLLALTRRTMLDAAIFESLGIGAAYPLLPEVVAGGTQIGVLRDDAAQALGLRPGLPVHLGPGDAGAATLGAGSGEPGVAYLYLGTSGWVAFTATEPASPERGVLTIAHPDPARCIPVAPLLTAGGNLEWVRDLFGRDDYAALIESALARPENPPLYLPYLNGERSPIRDPLARGAFVGLSAATTRADLDRAVLEGVAFAYRHALDALLSAPPSSLTLTGGGTRSAAWCQLFADVIGVPVAIAGDAANVGVRGAVLAAQVARGEQTSYAPPGFFPVEATLQARPEAKPALDARYALFRDLYPALKSTFAGLGALSEYGG